ncbi:hypothetical protein [Micromonospora sp. NPDC047730]|uniref:hypothetical protein n=1 Tax=Micromonospora sp. NPDC047730 TaxID=3364253 RepID=UPI003719AAB7
MSALGMRRRLPPGCALGKMEAAWLRVTAVALNFFLECGQLLVERPHGSPHHD